MDVQWTHAHSRTYRLDFHDRVPLTFNDSLVKFNCEWAADNISLIEPDDVEEQV